MTNLDFLVKEKLHTGFGEVISATAYDDVLMQAGLNWTVDAHPAYTDIGGKKIEIPGTKVIVRSADEKPLGIVSDKYQIVNNADAFAFTESIFNSQEIEFVRGGSYRGGAATWLEAKITSEFEILGDRTECFLIFMNTHDGTGSVKALIVPNRVVCSNALNFPLKKASRHWRCVHSGDPMKKIDEARDVLLAGTSYMEALKEEAEMLQTIKLNDRQVDQFINRLFPINTEMTDRQKANQETRREQLAEVFYMKDDLVDFGSTGYKFISAVADYVDHVNGRNTKTGPINRFISVAHGNPIVDKAYDMVIGL